MPATSRSDVFPVRRYVALGDSFTAGAPGNPGAPRWPDELAAALRERSPRLEYHNLGEPFVTTREVATRQLAACVQLAPDLVSIVCGANDVLFSVRPDIDAHRSALDRIFATLRLHSPGATIVTATAPLIPAYMRLGPRAHRRVERGAAALNSATRAVAAQHGALCLDWSDHSVARERENFGADGLHPSPSGVRRAALACLEGLLNLPSRPFAAADAMAAADAVV